jgi:hypothetical protein
VPVTIEPDTKDWTWVLDARCPECGYDAPSLHPTATPEALRRNASAWASVLAGTDADLRLRPDSSTWSPLEYACHVRDVHRVFGARHTLVLDQADPLFESWDQDVAAAAGRYPLTDPATVAADLTEGAQWCARVLAGAHDAQWQRPGRRSNGSRFTLATLALYHLHDVEHHLWDVTGRRAG